MGKTKTKPKTKRTTTVRTKTKRERSAFSVLMDSLFHGGDDETLARLAKTSRAHIRRLRAEGGDAHAELAELARLAAHRVGGSRPPAS